MAALIDSVMQFNGTPQTVAYTGTAGTSTAINSAMSGPFAIVCLTSTTDCFWLASSAGTAATSSNGEFLPANVPHYKKVNTGDRISVVQSSTGGNLYISQQI